MRLHFIPIHVFRETPSVTFFDAGVPGSNGTDVVAHHGAATSPPDQNGSRIHRCRDCPPHVLVDCLREFTGASHGSYGGRWFGFHRGGTYYPV